jgi:pilus assembly protein Flp/PilA
MAAQPPWRLESFPREEMDVLHRLRREERGASAVEYGLLIAGIAAVIAIAVYSFGHLVGDKMGSDCGTVGGAIQKSVGGSTTPTTCGP